MIGSFMCPTLCSPITAARWRLAGCDFNMEEHRRRVAVREYSNSAPNSQEANMFHNFAALALSGKPDDSWGTMVLKTQQVVDACLQSADAGGRTVDVRIMPE